MNRLLKIASTLLVLVGLGFIYFYIFSKKLTAGIHVLEKPSYFVSQNFWYAFVAGAVVVLFAILGSFFAWHKHAEAKEEILLNAGYTDQKQIENWVDGSTLDMSRRESGETATSGRQDAASTSPVEEQMEREG